MAVLSVVVLAHALAVVAVCSTDAVLVAVVQLAVATKYDSEVLD